MFSQQYPKGQRRSPSGHSKCLCSQDVSTQSKSMSHSTVIGQRQKISKKILKECKCKENESIQKILPLKAYTLSTHTIAADHIQDHPQSRQI